jgi:polyisoprenoid-binding protein YceI
MSKFGYAKPLLAALGLSFSFCALAADWNVVPETSTVGFTALQQGTKFNGRFSKFTAKINLDAADPTKGSIAGTVDVSSVNTRDPDRDSQLADKDWFNAKEFPEAKFESQKIERSADGAYAASGELTIKGQTKPATLNFKLMPAATSAGAANSAQFTGTMAVNRFDFNVGEGWNDTSWVGQDITVEIKLDLKH